MDLNKRVNRVALGKVYMAWVYSVNYERKVKSTWHPLTKPKHCNVKSFDNSLTLVLG